MPLRARCSALGNVAQQAALVNGQASHCASAYIPFMRTFRPRLLAVLGALAVGAVRSARLLSVPSSVVDAPAR